MPRFCVYLDNAATSWPKPPEVIHALCTTYGEQSVSPGRGTHRGARNAEARIFAIRKRLCEFFGSTRPERVAFTYNSTHALNVLILGMATPGCHIVSTVVEHNSVLRPLHHLMAQGTATVDFAPVDSDGKVTPEAISALIRPNTAFVILNHVSNVTGLIQPVNVISRICSRKKVPLFLDASQSAGVIPVNMQEMRISAVAFTGHKSLMGPTGIGGLVLAEDVDPLPFCFGGTGFNSKSLVHPLDYPYRLEAGTLNILGIIGLSAGLDFIEKTGMDAIFSKEQGLVSQLIGGLQKIPGVTVHYPEGMRTGVVSCVIEDCIAEDAAEILDGEFNIAVRAGLHCAPLMHRHMGTDHHGTLRFSVGPFNIPEDIDAALDAVARIRAAV